jgi:glycine cleavage system regulatory protein
MVGRDHPGIVNRLSTLLLDHNANWLESRMANLQGEFAGILHADIEARHYPSLLGALADLEAEGLQIVARETGSNTPDLVGLRQLELEVVGTDRAGIVRDIAAVLASFEINIEEISTEFSEAPMSSAPLFRATAHITANRNIDLDEVQLAIENIANDLMTELKVKTT